MKAKTLVIVGGVAGGASAAARARRLTKRGYLTGSWRTWSVAVTS